MEFCYLVLVLICCTPLFSQIVPLRPSNQIFNAEEPLQGRQVFPLIQGFSRRKEQLYEIADTIKGLVGRLRSLELGSKDVSGKIEAIITIVDELTVRVDGLQRGIQKYEPKILDFLTQYVVYNNLLKVMSLSTGTDFPISCTLNGGAFFGKFCLAPSVGAFSSYNTAALTCLNMEGKIADPVWVNSADFGAAFLGPTSRGQFLNDTNYWVALDYTDQGQCSMKLGGVLFIPEIVLGLNLCTGTTPPTGKTYPMTMKVNPDYSVQYTSQPDDTIRPGESYQALCQFDYPLA